jgi:ABC-2 type transport system permease protein
MTLLSDLVIVWGALFTSDSAKFHAHLPLQPRTLFWGAAVEGAIWSLWAAVTLAVPIFAALAVTSHTTDVLSFVAAAMLGTVCFLLCSAACGAVLSLLLARLLKWLIRLKRFLQIGGALVFAAVIYGAVQQYQDTPITTNFLNAALQQVSFVRNPWLPPRWAQEAVSAALVGRWQHWAYCCGLLLTFALAVALIGEWIASHRLRKLIDQTTGRGNRRRSASRRWWYLPFLPDDLATLVAKDLRLFARDPAQIIQFVLYFGMLGFYLVMLPRIGKDFLHMDVFKRAVSLLNLTAISMALATFTGRFVFPLLSLEGRRMWILALAPWPRTRVVTGKLIFAITVGLPVATILVYFSGKQLNLSDHAIAYQCMVTGCMAIALSAMALGIGARLADYKQENPAKLASGYGGTINLMSSLALTGLLLVGAAVPLMRESSPGGSPLWLWIAGAAWSLGISGVWSWIGLRMARRWFGQELSGS